MTKKFIAAITKFSGSLGPRQVEAVVSTAAVDLAGDIVEPAGCVLRGKSVIVLAGHDPDRPIGRAEVRVGAGAIRAMITFAPEGVSRHADEICGLTKAGILTDLSIGFDPVESAPIPGSPGARRFTKWNLLEVSVVSVGCNPEAVVTQRALKEGRRLSADTVATIEKVLDYHEVAADMQDKAAALHSMAIAELGRLINSADDGMRPPKSALASDREREERRRRARVLALAPGAAPDPDRDRRQRRARFLAVSP